MVSINRFTQSFRLPLSFAVSSLLLGGCASIVTGTTQDITFQSFPNGALVQINGKDYGSTPLVATLDKKTNVTAVISKDGYKPVLMEITTTNQPWFWGNFMFGGLIGSTTDNLSGAIYLYAPDQYFIALEQKSTSSLEKETNVSKLESLTKFVVTRHQDILASLGAGSGEYVDSLALLLDIPDERKGEEIPAMFALSQEHSGPVAFAVALSQKYLPVGPVANKKSLRRNPVEAFRDGVPASSF